MDTKLRSNDSVTEERRTGKSRFTGRWTVMLVCFALCAVLSLAILAYGTWAFKSPTRSYVKDYQSSEFASQLYRDSYMLYWKLQQKEQDDFTLSPAQVFFPEYRESILPNTGFVREDFDSDEEYQMALEGHAEYLDSAADVFDQSLLDYMHTLSHDFDNRWAGTGYMVLDLATGAYLGTWNDTLADLARGEASSEAMTQLQNDYAYYAVLRFGENGSLGVPTVYGAAQDTMDILRTTDMEQILANNADHGGGYTLTGTMQPPTSMAVVFPVPKGMVANFYSNAARYDIDHMQQSSIPLLYYLAAFLAMGAAMLLWLRPKTGLRHNPAAQLPPEFSFFSILVVINFYTHSLEYSLMSLFRGDYTSALVERGLFPQLGALVSYGFFALVLAALFLLGMAGAASLMQSKEMGFRQYLRQRSVCVWFWHRFSTQIKAIWRWITDIDLSDKSNRAIIKILVANFVVLAFLCSIWFFGIFGLLVYTAILYFVLRNYLNRLKRNYAKLLDATGQMAGGRLDVPIDKDLGVFTPLGQELEKVQQGFTVAVREQTKSQRMKTELISNVSHDLKTPLTAIITYVNLLKRDDLTDEERRSYVATLDQKSQRLKHLIEDLFEMSKASSGNIVLHPTKVDLPALVRQVELEARDSLEEAGIEFRYNFPQGKVELLLDGEKTSRIFENLIMNVAKYGMPGTRAYVTIVAGEKLVTLEMKNVSKNELTFDAGEITERFMRGDASRSTDGSGLGLAIAKNFAEAQGAQFKIVTDGDMFKVYITFSRLPGVAVPRAAAQAEQAPNANPMAAGFTAPASSSYKPPAAAFATGPLPGGTQQPPYQGSYADCPGMGQQSPYQQQPASFGNMSFNQMADAAVGVANQAVNAMASAARTVADKARQAGGAVNSVVNDERQVAKQVIQQAKQQAREAQQQAKEARQQAKEATNRLRQEARQQKRDRKQGRRGAYPYTDTSFAGQQPWQNPQPGQSGPYQQASYVTPPPAYTPYAPAYTPPPNPEPPPAEVLNPEKLFVDIPAQPEAPEPMAGSPEVPTLHLENEYVTRAPKAPELNLETDFSAPAPEAPVLTLDVDLDLVEEKAPPAPQSPQTPDSGDALSPKLELYSMPELLFKDGPSPLDEPPRPHDENAAQSG